MGVSVRGYTRHQGGKLVTVHGYDTNSRDYAPEYVRTGRMTRSLPLHNRQAMNIAPPGNYTMFHPAAGSTEGVTPYQIWPSGEVRWRKSILPVKGAYQIPKRD